MVRAVATGGWLGAAGAGDGSCAAGGGVEGCAGAAAAGGDAGVTGAGWVAGEFCDSGEAAGAGLLDGGGSGADSTGAGGGAEPAGGDWPKARTGQRSRIGMRNGVRRMIRLTLESSEGL